MKVEFYFDPSCPWCWITSRFILLASNQRKIEIEWKLFSLAWKNNELRGEKSYYDHMPSHRVERVMLAASKSGADMLGLYTDFGIRHFLSGDEYSDDLIIEILEKNDLDKELINSADDKTLDKEIIKSSKNALNIIGEDIGVPTIVFVDKNNKKRGFFGPVLGELPTQEEATKLWDALINMSEVDNFYELKRGRTQSPDVYSTAKC